MNQTSHNRRVKLAFWGPGHVGSAILRAALQRPEFEVVGAKVFNPAKNGRDIGELVGVAPIGVRATTSAKEILALDADCVIHTASPVGVMDGSGDVDVIALLESGKNVISTAGYHNPSMPNFATANRAPASRLARAAYTGGVTLHGSGVHPSYMVERLVLTMTGMMTDVDHIRFVEAVDVSEAADGNLEYLGLGKPLAEINADFFTASFGDLYYGDMIGNVAHHLYGSDMRDVRVEHDLRALASNHDIETPELTIEAGTAAVLHMTHRGFLGDRLFFTNEEVWYAGRSAAYFGEDLPFGNFGSPASYIIEINGAPSTMRAQMELESSTADTAPIITQLTVVPVLDAVIPVCNAEPGIAIPDPAVHLRADTRIDPDVGAAAARPTRPLAAAGARLSASAAALKTRADAEIARFIAGPGKRPLARLESGSLRAAAITALANGLARRFDPEQAADMDAVIELRLTRPGSEETDPIEIAISNRQCRVTLQPSQSPDVCIRIGLADLIRLSTGAATMAGLVQQNKIKPTGDLALCLRFGAVFGQRPPQY